MLSGVREVGLRVTNPQEQTQDDRGRLQAAEDMDLAGSTTSLVAILTRATAVEMKPYKIRPMEFNVLRHCVVRGDCNATELADILPVDASRISRLVTGLVDRGLLVRHRQTEDRRVVTLQITNEGRVLVALLLQRMGTYISRLVRDVGDEELSVFESVAREIIDAHYRLRTSQ